MQNESDSESLSVFYGSRSESASVHCISNVESASVPLLSDDITKLKLA